MAGLVRTADGLERGRAGWLAALVVAVLVVLKVAWSIDEHYITRREFQQAMQGIAQRLDRIEQLHATSASPAAGGQ